MTLQQRESLKTQLVLQSAAERIRLESESSNAQLKLVRNALVQQQEVLKNNKGKRVEAEIEATADLKKIYEGQIATYTGVIDSLIAEQARHRDNALAIEKQIADAPRTFAAERLQIEQQFMTNEEKLRSNRVRLEQNYQTIRAELAKGENGDQKLINELMGEQKGLVTDIISTERKDAPDAIARQYGKWHSTQLLNELDKTRLDVLGQQNVAEQKNADAFNESIGTYQRAVGVLQSDLEGLQRKLKEQYELKLDVNTDLAWDELNAFLNKIPTVRTILIRTVTEGAPTDTKAEGGLVVSPVERFAAGGLWPRVRGRLPGYGGGDRNRATLEEGDFVLRKEAVAKYGDSALSALHGLRFPVSSTGSGREGECPSRRR